MVHDDEDDPAKEALRRGCEGFFPHHATTVLMFDAPFINDKTCRRLVAGPTSSRSAFAGHQNVGTNPARTAAAASMMT